MEFSYKNKTYVVGSLDTFTQLNIARKITPAMPLVDGLVKTANAEKDLSLLFLMALSQLDDQASEFVMRTCLKAVSVKQETGWAKVASPQGELMFADLTVQELLHLVVKVIEVHLGDFFRTALGSLATSGAAV